jgi:hypothetical protein
MKITAITAIVTAGICFTVTATTGFAQSLRHHSRGHTYVIQPGDRVYAAALDVGCLYEKANAVIGNALNLYCNRESDNSDVSAGASFEKYEVILNWSKNARSYTAFRVP